MYFDQLWNSLFQSPFSMLITLKFTSQGASMHLDLYKLFGQYIHVLHHTHTHNLSILNTHDLLLSKSCHYIYRCKQLNRFKNKI